MVARTKQKQRGRISRNRKKMILIGAEGKNETELTYFKAFNRKQKTFTVKAAKGNSTDPKGIVEDTANSVKREELDFEEGDPAFCLFDADTDISKQNQIDAAVRMATKNHIEVLLSVPCFEIWFLQHFESSTAELSSDGAITRLSRYIPTYGKSMDVFSDLEPFMEEAIERAKRLEKHHDSLGRHEKSMERNPSTEAYRLVEKLKKEIDN